MIAVCNDNSHTWRNVLTLGKEYEVLKVYDDRCFDVKCDDGKVRAYRSSRFNLKEDEK